MSGKNFPWKRDFKFVEPWINAEGIRVYPFNRSFPIDVSFQRASGPRHVRLNRHEFFEVLYLYAGNTNIQVRDSYLPMSRGDIMVMGPDIYHRIIPPPQGKVELVSLNFQPEIIRSSKADAEEERYLGPFLAQGKQFPHVISECPALSQQALHWILAIHRELPAESAINRLAIRTYLRMLLLLLLKHYADYLGTREVLGRKQMDQDRLQPAFELLDQKFDQTIQVEDAARACAMSASHFMRFFKMTIGQSFRAYLTGFRIAKAQHLLSSGEASIAEISQQVGFCSQSYFTEVFRASVGMTPRGYRRWSRVKSASS